MYKKETFSMSENQLVYKLKVYYRHIYLLNRGIHRVLSKVKKLSLIDKINQFNIKLLGSSL